MYQPCTEPLEPRRLLAANPTVIDLLVLYTTQAKLDQGGNSAIQAEIQGVVDTVNLAMQSSQVPVTIRLVHAEEIAGYNGSGNVQTDELRLQNPNDGSLDSALPTRNTWGADLVCLVTNGATN
jgi:peptidyl-Asp metalloendopeptidase